MDFKRRVAAFLFRSSLAVAGGQSIRVQVSAIWSATDAAGAIVCIRSCLATLRSLETITAVRLACSLSPG